ncbi:hypothetical protein TWF694_005269 [Orbilia ellipsospora]|uniref:BHLH domain-containing protein n=1 Tax=Orbilia ellipsospora TaxID=2528407 RepID=A0AAV9WSY2_9PEZI
MENIKSPSDTFSRETKFQIHIEPDPMEQDEARAVTTNISTETNILLSDSQVQQSPTSPKSPPVTFGDPEYEGELKNDDAEAISFSPLSRPVTPTPPMPQFVASSPLSPDGSLRALQSSTPRSEPPTPSPPTGQKTAYTSSPKHYSKLRSKLRRDRERELANQKGVMGKSKLEDHHIRERMIKSLRKNMAIPEDVRGALTRLSCALNTDQDHAWRIRTSKYTFLDYCEMWRFQYLEIEEFIHLEGWDNTELDDAAAIRYVISYCRREAGMPQGAGG